MDDRRTFLALAAALVPASLITVAAQTPTPAPAGASTPPRELARHTLTGPLAAFDALLIELHPGPGQGREHRHNGPVLGYVLEGRVRFGVNHEPERIYGVARPSSKRPARFIRPLGPPTRRQRECWSSWWSRKPPTVGPDVVQAEIR